MKSCHRFITAQNTGFNAGVPCIVCRSYHTDPPAIVLDHRDLGMALGSFDVGCDLLQELQFRRFADAISVIEYAFEFKDQSMFNELIQLTNGIFRDCPGSEIDLAGPVCSSKKKSRSCVDQSPSDA